MKIIKAPQTLPEPDKYGFVPNSLFLGGSIEMGTAENWQERIEKELSGKKSDLYEELYIFNPRRDDWDSSWIQSIDNPQFNEQVNWEISAQEIAGLNIYYFSPETKSPITLLELGLFHCCNNSVVCCPHGFWRKGNVDIVCKRYNVPQVNNIEGLIKHIKRFFYIFD